MHATHKICTTDSPDIPPTRKISAETSRDGLGELFLSVWSQRQDETKREHADETDRKMNPNNQWSRQKENIYIIHLINNIFKT